MQYMTMEAEATEQSSTKHDDQGDDPPKADVPTKKEKWEDR